MCLQLGTLGTRLLEQAAACFQGTTLKKAANERTQERRVREGHCKRERELVEVILTTASNVLRVYNARVCFPLCCCCCSFLMAHMVAEKVFVYHYSRIGRMRAMVVVLPLTTDDQHLTE